jgi:hypothetical protein
MKAILLIFEKSMSHRNFEIALFLGFSGGKTKTVIFQRSVGFAGAVAVVIG